MKGKKMMALLLAASLTAGLCACGGTSGGENASSGSAAASEAESSGAAAESVTEETSSEESAAAESGAASEEASAEESAADDTAGKTELIVFAAASMQETLTEIKGLYEAAHPEITLTCNLDSSGTLKTQIEEGAACDIFISASPKQMNQLDIEADPEVNTDGLDFVATETRFNLLENKVTLAVPEGNPAGIESFDQLAEKLKNTDVFMAMGNDDVPVGQYTQKILDYYNLPISLLNAAGCLTYGSNVKEVTTQITEGSVACGVIYATDAFSAGLTVVDEATKEMCGQVIYPAAMLKASEHPEEAQAFLDYLRGDEAMGVFESVGFSKIG